MASQTFCHSIRWSALAWWLSTPASCLSPPASSWCWGSQPWSQSIFNSKMLSISIYLGSGEHCTDKSIRVCKLIFSFLYVMGPVIVNRLSPILKNTLTNWNSSVHLGFSCSWPFCQHGQIIAKHLKIHKCKYQHEVLDKSVHAHCHATAVHSLDHNIWKNTSLNIKIILTL